MVGHILPPDWEVRNLTSLSAPQNWLLVGRAIASAERDFQVSLRNDVGGQFAFAGVPRRQFGAHGIGLLVRRVASADGPRTAIGHLTVAKPTSGIYDNATISGFFGNLPVATASTSSVTR